MQISVIEYAGIPYTLINPSIRYHGEVMMRNPEGCLSYFQYRGVVERYEHIVVEAMNKGGEKYSIETQDKNFSSLLQHEIDYLHGTLYVDHLPNGDRDLYVKEGVPVIQ